jgi:alpha-L-fucosidase 2
MNSITYRLLFAAAILITIIWGAGDSTCAGAWTAPSDSGELPDVLWYRSPASEWIEALPIGNGRLGAMVFGQPENDRLQLNDVTVWSGDPNPNADRKDAYTHLSELRRLLSLGKYREAETFANSHFNGPAPYSDSYQTLGDLKFRFTLPSQEITEYRRDLNLSQAVASVTFKSGGTTFHREFFSSAADHAIVERLSSDKPGEISFSLSLSRDSHATTRVTSPGALLMTGDTGKTLSFNVQAKVLAEGGEVAADRDNQIVVSRANEATILLTAATSFVLDYDKAYKGADPGVARSQMESAAQRDYQALKSAHIAEYSKYFNRVTLKLGPSDATLPTDERLKRYQETRDPSLVALFYQFGRYLLISSSRPDNPLPSNSQGIWGDGFDLPWKCDYKSNINYEMNYWPAETANLSEMHLPMLRMTENLVKPGTKTAKAYFGPDTPGWLVEYTTNGWSWTSPGARLPWGIWCGGSGWMCQDLWEHFAFGRDLAYLRSVYPVMKGASEFWLANLVTSPNGTLITSPSTSPENNFTTDSGVTATITQGAAMEREIVWDLLDNTAQACAVLDCDREFAKRVVAARDRIEPLAVGKAGQLMEWNGDWDMNARDLHHRHISHLFALFPGHQITLDKTPELAAAAKKSLEIRGDSGTGWSIAWKINCWARLHDGNHALRLIGSQLRYTKETHTVMEDAGGTYPDLFDAHPPFQIDGNFGFTSGIDEMLLQSQERYIKPATPQRDCYVIDLLSALPDAWPSGEVRGLRARGGVDVSLRWNGGVLQKATLTSMTAVDCKVRYREKMIPISLHAGQTLSLDSNLVLLPSE